ncbi:MAG: signal peptidase I [Candidatus Delongbacteria bacterium]|nr:signal peptidase I [Candidatus Delongbacteria bacterium]
MSKKNYKYQLFIAVLLIILICKTIIFEFYRVTSTSMSETILPGDFILVNRLVFGTNTPNRIIIPFFNYEFSIPSIKIPPLRNIKERDIVVIRNNKHPECENNLIKRVAAVEGQVVNSSLDSFIVPDDKIFVLGDNLATSYDSRDFGFIDKSEVIGKAVIIYASIDIDGKFRWKRFFKNLE